MAASTRASRVKRTPSSSRTLARTLSATRDRVSRSYARKTAPAPPRPPRTSISKRPKARSPAPRLFTCALTAPLRARARSLCVYEVARERGEVSIVRIVLEESAARLFARQMARAFVQTLDAFTRDRARFVRAIEREERLGRGESDHRLVFLD